MSIDSGSHTETSGVRLWKLEQMPVPGRPSSVRGIRCDSRDTVPRSRCRREPVQGLMAERMLRGEATDFARFVNPPQEWCLGLENDHLVARANPRLFVEIVNYSRVSAIGRFAGHQIPKESFTTYRRPGGPSKSIWRRLEQRPLADRSDGEPCLWANRTRAGALSAGDENNRDLAARRALAPVPGAWRVPPHTAARRRQRPSAKVDAASHGDEAVFARRL